MVPFALAAVAALFSAAQDKQQEAFQKELENRQTAL